jgi:selenocysteine lyase/cysteine desulfurase
MSADWNAIRAEFPALARWTFLNTATFGQLPRRAVEAVARHLAHRDELACSDFLDWFDDADRVREQIARLIHCEPGDVAFVPNAATALGLLLGGLDWRPGDRIVTLKDEFPNNLYHPALLARHGVEVVEAEWPRFYDAVSTRARLVVLSEVNYTTGFRPPLREIADFLRERGVLLYVDGTQSLGALRFDVREVRPDMLAVHGYKWLLCPNGAGFMYVAPALRERLHPSVIGWRSHRDWRRVDNLHHGAPEFKDEAEKYEGGMLTFPVIYPMGASLEMMLEIGPEAIEARVMELAARIRGALRRLGGRLLFDESPHHDSPVVAARFEGRDASALARELKSRRVIVSARHGYLRVSAHFYNNEADVGVLEDELGSLLGCVRVKPA